MAGEIALASMLLIGAGLAMKSFVNLQHVNSGIRPDHVLTFRMRLPTDNLYKDDREQAAFYRQVLDKVQRIPGIQSAGLSDVLPLGSKTTANTSLSSSVPCRRGRNWWRTSAASARDI